MSDAKSVRKCASWGREQLGEGFVVGGAAGTQEEDGARWSWKGRKEPDPMGLTGQMKDVFLYLGRGSDMLTCVLQTTSV